ncbi:MAG: filamentous hemagglutinin N-terminal domain-containing protein, partial [bacterium]
MAFVLINLLSFSTVFALPQGPQVESGSAVFESPDPMTLNIRAQNNTVINFSSFNVASNEVVNIYLPSENAALLSRDLSGNASHVLGSLIANGNVFLVNTQGISFGSSARVQVNNMVTSTLDIATNNFLNSNYRFERREGDPYAEVSNEGNIRAKNLVLQGSSVNNTGIIQAEVGSVHLASGDKTTVSFDPGGLIQVVVNQQTTGKAAGAAHAVANSGRIEAVKVVMEAETSEDLFEDVINQTGTVKASQVVEQNGVIRIIANGAIQVSGDLEAPQGQIEVLSTERSIAMDRAMAMLAKEIQIKAAQDVHIN